MYISQSKACSYRILPACGIFLALILLLSSLAVDGSLLRLTAKVVESRVVQATFAPEERVAPLKDAFQHAGCPVAQIFAGIFGHPEAAWTAEDAGHDFGRANALRD